MPIIEYHYATFTFSQQVRMRPEWLEAQLRWLADNHFHTLTSAELAEFVRQGGAPAHSAALTFDVGWTHFDEYSGVIVPALRRYGLHAIFFVLPSRTSETCDGLTTCWPLLLAWQNEGLISIESHSLYHVDYTTLSPQDIERDAAHSKSIIEAHTGQPVRGLCYPFDDVSPAAAYLLEKLGYKYAVAGATRPDRSARAADPAPFALPRYYPYSGDADYPAIHGERGLAFGALMLAASAPERVIDQGPAATLEAPLDESEVVLKP
ncbi:MAG: polysaccharide deacetylase family protein [Anaerolineales bacterium]